jgi:polysaccharide pyruvyl transferase WcaK-like protein
VTSRRVPARQEPSERAPVRVGLFGLLGAGNLGNDGSVEAVLEFLRAEHPDAALGFLCSGPERVMARYGVPATRLNWYDSEAQTASSMSSIAAKALGKVLDAIRIAAWVRRFDVVIVPGMGVLEATLPLRPWGFPYALFLLCASGRIFGTRVALVSVGADVIRQRPTRWLIRRAARFAHYRSYRDDLSREAMRGMGVDTSDDSVYPDLAFALPTPTGVPAVSGTVGVGVMAYYGGNGDRARADEIHRSYVGKMKRFVRWLVDDGRQVRLFTGDELDEGVVAEILADVREHRPDLEPSRVVADNVGSLAELMSQMATVDSVVATRYHNVLCALKLAKPTVSIGYAAKNDVLMAEMGLSDFCQSVRSFDVDQLIERFTLLEGRCEQLERTMTVRRRAAEHRLGHQFAELSSAFFPCAASGSRTDDCTAIHPRGIR